MPTTRHIPGTGIDDAMDFFNRRFDYGTPAAASTTAVVNAYALAAGATTSLTPGGAGVALSAVTYGGRGATVTTPSTNTSDGGFVNDAYSGSTLGKLDSPRVLQYVASAAGQAGSVVVTGLDRRGVVQTETITLNGVTAVIGKIAFAYIISISLPAQAAAGNTCSIGIGSGLGMRYRPLDANSERRCYVNSVLGTNGTIDAVNSVYTPNAAVNGTNGFVSIYDSID